MSLCQGVLTLALPLKASLLVCTLLVTNIGADLLQLEANCRDGIPSRPEVFTREVALSSIKLPCNGDGTFPFQKANPRGYRMLRRDLDAYMHMIRHHVAFNDAAFLLASQLVEDGSQGFPNRAIEGLRRRLGTNTT